MRNERVPLPIAALVHAVGKVVIAIGVLVLVGWFFDLEALKRLSANFVAMNPVSAICFVLIGTAFECLRNPVVSRSVRLTGIVLALVVAAVGGAKLISYILGFPLRLDAILFGMKLEEAAHRIPNQMAPNTALNFLLAGAALCLLDARPRRLPISHLLALFTVATAVLAILGYAYGVTQFTRVANPFIPMALHTAIAFLLLCSGILFARGDTDLARVFSTKSTARLVACRLIPSATIFIFGIGWLRLYGERNGYFPGALGTALVVVTTMFSLIGVIWWTISSTHRLEEARDAAELEAAQSKEELAISLKNLELVMNHASELICSIGSDGRVLSINEATVQLLGLSPDQMVGSALMEYVHPDDQKMWESTCRRALGGVASASLDLRMRRRDGTFAGITWSIQSSVYHRRMFGVGRLAGTNDSLRPWDQTSA